MLTGRGGIIQINDVKGISIYKKKDVSGEMYLLKFKDGADNIVEVEVGHLLRDFFPEVNRSIKHGCWNKF